MTTLAALVAATPAATRGVPTGFVYGTGTWRHVLELADPSAGASVAWYDLTAIIGPRIFTGYEYNRGSDSYLGRYRASVATLDLQSDDDRLAPWNDDTSATFGTHVELGPGLLLRSGFIRVDGGVVVEWNPRFTLKVESWGDASAVRGQIRTHRIVARDLMTSFATMPLPASSEENWSDRVFRWLTDSAWPYGSLVYGAQFTAAAAPILLLPARPESSSAAAELDTTCDPTGLVWYTNRLGQLVIRPRVDDTFHAAAFAAGATGDEWPGDVTPVSFAWWACEEPEGESPDTVAAYAIDTPSIESFGVDRTERWVINDVRVTTPASGTIPAHTYADDDAISVQRYDRKVLTAGWGNANDVVAAQILSTRAFADREAHPLATSVRLRNFHPDPAYADWLSYIAVDHRNSDAGLSVYANGWLRSYRERVRPLGCTTEWDLTLVLDVYASTSAPGLLPVVDLRLAAPATDTCASFAWDYPTQPVAATNVQVRLLPASTIWLTLPYPGDGTTDALDWCGLSPSSDYQLQVRVVRIVDGVVEQFSPLRSLAFETAETVDGDISVDDGDLHGEFPEPDDPELCYIGWELQWATDGDGPWTTIDSGTITTPPYVLDYDMTGLNDDYWYRFRWREVCDGVPGAWHEEIVPTPIVCLEPAALGSAPYNDADLIAYWPQVCPEGIEEALTDDPVVLGPALHSVGFDPAGVPVLVSGPEGLVAYDVLPGAPAGSAPLTLAWRGYLTEQPTTELILDEYAGAWLSILPHGSGFRVRANVRETGAGITFVGDSTDFLLSTIYNLALTHDPASGDLRVFVNAVEKASALGTVGNRDSFGQFVAWLPANSWGTDYAAWARILDDSELPGFVAPTGPSVTINKAAAQPDPTSALSVVFTVVFSEAVSGFATGDVTLSGSAGATTAVVSGTGPTYTVTVTGMTSTGTVIATIAAGVCTSVATSAPNAASTSTDNSVDWNFTPIALGSRCLVWWDFTDASSMTLSGSDITLINDKSPTDAPAGTADFQLTTNAVGADAPTRVTSVINGLQVARFDGVDDGFVQASGLTFAFNNLTIEVWVVCKPADSGIGALFSEGDSGNTAYRLYDVAAADQLHFNYENSVGTTRFDNIQNRTAGAGTWELIIATDKGAAVGTVLEIVGVDIGTTGAYTRDAVSLSKVSVGCCLKGSISLFYAGDIAEMFFLTSAATSTERTKLAGYLNAKYAKSWSPA